MNKILVTGAAGFIGSHLTEKLLSSGHLVTGIDNFDDFYGKETKLSNLTVAQKNPGFTFIELDITDRKSLFSKLEKEKFDVVVHLAAKAGVRPSLKAPDEYLKTNVEGYCNVLELSRTAGWTKIVFGSSSSVYGTNEKVPFAEDDKLNNIISPYAFSKKAGEELSELYHRLYNFSLINLRFFTVYGPRQRPDLAIHKFLKANINGKTIEIFGDGSMSRDYTFVGDIVKGINLSIDKLLNSENKIYQTYNLGNSSPVSLNKLIEEIEAVTKIKSKLNYKDVPMGDVPRTFADVTKASSELGYVPTTSLKKGLELFVDWLKDKK